ncbi:hypothetical protein CASFOL_005311 [Castilleja foliolosa]|uniref:Uncharacterized protein n=1 Tax=Castilleja foliolosa TaxID=1961234 RepID=A0ABD3E327_9LAMI
MSGRDPHAPPLQLVSEPFNIIPIHNPLADHPSPVTPSP